MNVFGISQDDFFKLFGAWLRLEPRCRSDDFARGLEACTADPAWLLARQWQVGEFWGEDNGSPIQALIQYSTQPLKTLQLGAGKPFDLPNAPLEMPVEEEWPDLDWRARVRVGQQFERLLRAQLQDDADLPAVIEAFREEYPVTLPPPGTKEWDGMDYDSRAFVGFMAGRVVDGQALFQGMDFTTQGSPPLPVSLVKRLPPQIRDNPERLTRIQTAVQNAMQGLKDWCNKLNIRPKACRPDAWRMQSLDYRFELNPPLDGRAHLIAPSYRNGLDWHTFNVASQNGWESQPPVTAYPTRIRIGGVSLGWWTFDDYRIDFGRLDTAKPDLAKLQLIEFALIYGGDWYALPLPVQMPNLVKIDSLVVRNVFGEELTVGPVCGQFGLNVPPQRRWEIFTLSRATAPNNPDVVDPDAAGWCNVLFIPPVTSFRQESPPLEEVCFLRDEGANMVWGVERTVLNGLGQPVHGFDAQRERTERQREAQARLERVQAEGPSPAPDQPPSGKPVPRYRLATTVPENWIPFIALALPDSDGLRMRLCRAQMLRNMADEKPTPIPAMSSLFALTDESLLWLEEATIPRSGLQVQLTAQLARWVDGTYHVWLGRKVVAGRGEGSSGLRFDVL